jgi:hypothetical protein
MMQVQYFGDSWGAPICQDQVPVPIGDRCLGCNELIWPSDQGLLIWHGDPAVPGYRPWHLDCFLRFIGAPESC